LEADLLPRGGIVAAALTAALVFDMTLDAGVAACHTATPTTAVAHDIAAAVVALGIHIGHSRLLLVADRFAAVGTFVAAVAES
jgi:uncharacterized integral membrane protein